MWTKADKNRIWKLGLVSIRKVILLETRLDMNLVGRPSEAFDLHWTMSCGNDVLDLAAAPVPGPGTLFLLGPGLAALWAISKRRRNKSR